MAKLLAVDLGLDLGLAAYDARGRLGWYRSRHLASPAALRRWIRTLLDETPDLERLVLEGGGPLGELWEKEAARRGLTVRGISAEDWRRKFLYPRQYRDRDTAKESADGLARRVIAWSGAQRPTSLRSHAAEAILVGLWGVLDAGWLPEMPKALRP